jgi:hypothetical protein
MNLCLSAALFHRSRESYEICKAKYKQGLANYSKICSGALQGE